MQPASNRTPSCFLSCLPNAIRDRPLTSLAVGTVALLAIGLFVNKLLQTEAPIRASKEQAELKWRVHTLTNIKVIENEWSDHPLVIFVLPDRPPVITSNLMCCGEDFDRKKANPFGIDPTIDGEIRQDRFRGMCNQLYDVYLTNLMNLPIIALQEFPRQNSTGDEEFIKMINRKFADLYGIHYGTKDNDYHNQSQLCMLVPKGRQMQLIDHKQMQAWIQPSRLQVVVVNGIVYINIHPSRDDKIISEDRFLNELEQFCETLLKQYEEIQIVGDWNSRKALLQLYWKNIYSAGPTQFYQEPIDHLVVIRKAEKAQNN